MAQWNMEKENTVFRRSKILEMIEEKGRLNVQELSAYFKVSEVTIRNDLGQLEQKGLLIRTRGGAIRNQRVGVDSRLSEKARRNRAEKMCIGKKAAALIRDGETIILDSGTTTFELARNLSAFSELTVITNALNIAIYLAGLKSIKVIVPGGLLREPSLSLVGPSAGESLRNYYCDKAFLGVDGIDTAYGVTTPNLEEAHLNRAMIRNAREVIVLTDSSKFSKRSFAFIAPVTEIDKIVTDNRIRKEDMELLISAGVDVVTC